MTERLPVTEAGLSRAAELLRSGGLVAFGTETVYGLGADATDSHAVARIFAAKGRPDFNPLISHFASAADAFAHVQATPIAETLARRFMPGPLTLVMTRRADGAICDLATSGLPTAAVRVPGHETALTLLRAVGRPVAAPSANLSGSVSPSDADHVLDGLEGRIDAVLDSGPCSVGVESTVLDISGPNPVLLRHGGVPLEAIEAEIGPVLLDAPDEPSAPRSPGQLSSHYAPSLPLRLNATDIEPDEALLAFGPASRSSNLCWNLSESGDLEEAAARLFAGLRHLDAEGRKRGLKRIAAAPVPSHGLGAAIGDRLARAAAPRPPHPHMPPPPSDASPREAASTCRHEAL
ncbi:translation modulator Sua5/YciO/YrdC/YwlC [Acetobacter nitrogenifigens DSM 23921 = NBRC 105050]|uniref:Threonylcarbamoyl-AMP synthase n=1 Tax=Acetobacter nitrogenifigens DSM 23921 = NBRC 105050 TaxID=1120919 RepID=A0A511X9E9_9PROT|nr:L-threonylcarbamoyladenylate synthase [Acetobacter nitrogenifigens]GBQ93449.1 translation modulator Sua5/YciO/YrdC/YwlC [Acetobacter nitrogenifigens DSM 23921 = NBRC 105050]GEN59568.1 threonylcarbamoyl-AMP synthase [Acetobacter nitrogenifigens DSM 23921 = NBRC 105050]